MKMDNVILSSRERHYVRRETSAHKVALLQEILIVQEQLQVVKKTMFAMPQIVMRTLTVTQKFSHASVQHYAHADLAIAALKDVQHLTWIALQERAGKVTAAVEGCAILPILIVPPSHQQMAYASLIRLMMWTVCLQVHCWNSHP